MSLFLQYPADLLQTVLVFLVLASPCVILSLSDFSALDGSFSLPAFFLQLPIYLQLLAIPFLFVFEDGSFLRQSLGVVDELVATEL